MPGINLVMSQPISDRVDEMVSGVRADVAVMLYGDDLDVLVEKAAQIASIAIQSREHRTRAWIGLAVSNTSISDRSQRHCTLWAQCCRRK